MDHGMMIQYEELLLRRAQEIRRLQDALSIQMSDNTSLVKDNISLMDDHTKLVDEIEYSAQRVLTLRDEKEHLIEANISLTEELARVQERSDRLEMYVSDRDDDISDQAEVHAFEIRDKDKEIAKLKSKVYRLEKNAKEDARLIEEMEVTIRRQLGDVEYLEKLSAALETECDKLERENTALKDTRDGLLTHASTEIDRLNYLRGIDRNLFDILSSSWHRIFHRLAKFKTLCKDGTVVHLTNAATSLEWYGDHEACEHIHRVVRTLLEDANDQQDNPTKKSTNKSSG